MPRPFLRATAFAHELVREVLREGDLAVDATCGRGHDTLFLAELVGAEGEVLGFDIQKEAIESTRSRLVEAAMDARVTLHLASHDRLTAILGERRAAMAVLFNLGYLPGGDKGRITTSATTLPALEQALTALAPGGLLGVTVYPGHPGGGDEAKAVGAWMGALPQETCEVIRYGFINQRGDPPYVFGVRKRD